MWPTFTFKREQIRRNAAFFSSKNTESNKKREETMVKIEARVIAFPIFAGFVSTYPHRMKTFTVKLDAAKGEIPFSHLKGIRSKGKENNLSTSSAFDVIINSILATYSFPFNRRRWILF